MEIDVPVPILNGNKNGKCYKKYLFYFEFSLLNRNFALSK